MNSLQFDHSKKLAISPLELKIYYTLPAIYLEILHERDERALEFCQASLLQGARVGSRKNWTLHLPTRESPFTFILFLLFCIRLVSMEELSPREVCKDM